MTIEQIAHIAHEVDRIYSFSLGNFTAVQWQHASQAARDAFIACVSLWLKDPYASPQQNHDRWAATVEGATLYEDLDRDQQFSSAFLAAIIQACASDVDQEMPATPPTEPGPVYADPPATANSPAPGPLTLQQARDIPQSAAHWLDLRKKPYGTPSK